uniref:Rab-GAP TBC domain-containing protein n=1 Tax=Globisporangium ultimum (strain ATCC 200006 / CBS 805.95 / DAOM BR144) TaxID=431595 RepID=K3X833_GLOUD
MTTKSLHSSTVIYVNRYFDSHGKTLLHHACRFGKLQVVNALLYHGVNTTAQCEIGRTAFHDAVSSGNKASTLQVLKILYNHEPTGLNIVDANGTHILHLAAIHGSVDVISWYAKLLSAQAVSQSSPPPSSSPASGMVASMAITSFSGRNLLHYAAYNGRLQVLRWVLSSENEWNFEFSASALDANGYSLLHYAAMGGHLEVCEWLVFHSSTRNDLNIMAKNSEGQTAFDLAKTPDVKTFVAQVSQIPPAPTHIHCIGADSCSLGIAWTVEPHSDLLLREILTPLWFELEYCKKPKGLTSASGLLSMVMLMPSNTPQFIIKWEQVNVCMQSTAREYWLSGLERDTEYLVRIRAVNRNGSSTYSIPNLATSEFVTTGAGGLRRLLGFFPSYGANASSSVASFIGTLHFELLEARHLHVTLNKHERSQKKVVVADHGHFYGLINMELPETLMTTPTHRRQTVPIMRSRSKSGASTRRLYRVRTDNASIQEEMVLSGSLHAFQHPAFQAATTFRVPEASQTTISIEIRHKTHRVDSCVGVVTISLMDLIRGLPAKMQWLALQSEHRNAWLSPRAQQQVKVNEPIRGEVLIRTLFLADGITALPHPTRADVLSASAQELLEDDVETDANYYHDTDGNDSDGDSKSQVTEYRYGPRKSTSASSSSSKFDSMGFRVLDPRVQQRDSVYVSRKVGGKSYQYYKLLQDCVDRRQLKRWREFHHQSHCEHGGENCSNSDACAATNLRRSCTLTVPKQLKCPYEARSSNILRELVWNGVPTSWRPTMYLRMSGALRKSASYPANYFQSLLVRVNRIPNRSTIFSDDEASDDSDADEPADACAGGEFDAVEKQIQVDLQRTFAGNQCWINSSDGQKALERVLLAYAVHNQSLGYCQSMTFIVGRLLCLFQYHQDNDDFDDENGLEALQDCEEQVFWMLAVFCEDFFPSYYTKGMIGLQVDGMVLEFLMRKRLPKVYRHLQQLQTPHIGLLLVTQWLLPICCAVFPSETSFRMMDVLIFEGSHAVFALAIALLRISQYDILAETKDYMQLFRFLKERDMRLYDTPLLLEIAYAEHALLADDIPSLRNEFANVILETN